RNDDLPIFQLVGKIGLATGKFKYFETVINGSVAIQPHNAVGRLAVKGGEPTYKYKLIGRCAVLDGTDKFICPGPCIKRRIDLSISVQTHNPVRSLAVEGSEIPDHNELIVCHQHRSENIAVSARIELFRCFIKIIGRSQLPVGAQPNYLPHRAYV